MYFIKLQSTIFLILFLLQVSFSRSSNDHLQKAYDYFNSGAYEKAIEAFEKAIQNKSNTVAAHLGLAEVLIETGQYQKALENCQQALKLAPRNPDVINLTGEIYWLLGEFEKARQHFQKAVTINRQHLRALLNLGKMQWQWGEHWAAQQTFQYFIIYYQSHRSLTSEELNYIAEACIYLERFRDANNLFYEATNLDKHNWRGFIKWGNLFLSKYNVPDAISTFEDALKINPSAAEAHLGLARCYSSSDYEKAMTAVTRALDINPNFVAARNFVASLQIAMGNYRTALEKLEQPLHVNPNSLKTHSLRAVAYYLMGEMNKFSEIEQKIFTLNPNYGDLYFQLAEALSRRYLFKEAAEFYRKCLKLNPGHHLARAGLGTSLSRLGKEQQAKAELEKAFSHDPYNKYVGNLLTLFDEFPHYKAHRKTRFILRIHEKDDPVLAPYAEELTQECLTYLSRKYPAPWQEPVLVEIFPEHDDFAVRCFGLPGAQAFLGICFGNVVAMDSPRARTKGDFVWGETLWHELVHVTHLRLTNNRIPRWLAEGIAVYETSTAKPYWDMNLDIPFIAALKNNRLLPLKDLDQGFNRPVNPGQVTLSYFQAAKIVEFIVSQYGFNKLLDMFPQFKEGKNTQQVIQAVFGKEVNSMDQEFKGYLKQKYQLDHVDFDFDFKEFVLYSQNPEKWKEYLNLKIEKSPNNPFLNLQFGLYYKNNGQLEKAIPYLKKAKSIFPKYVQGDNPYKLLAEIYIEKGMIDKAINELETLTSLNGKDLKTLNQLVDLYFQKSNYSDAIGALKKIIYVSPFDYEVHQKLGTAYLKTGHYNQAIQEFQILLKTNPPDLAGANCDLATAYLMAGKKAEAKKAALAALEIAPQYERAQEILLKTIE